MVSIFDEVCDFIGCTDSVANSKRVDFHETIDSFRKFHNLSVSEACELCLDYFSCKAVEEVITESDDFDSLVSSVKADSIKAVQKSLFDYYHKTEEGS